MSIIRPRRRRLFSRKGIIELSCGCTVVVSGGTVTARLRFCRHGAILYATDSPAADRDLVCHWVSHLSPHDMLLHGWRCTPYDAAARLLCEFNELDAGRLVHTFDHRLIHSGWRLLNIDGNYRVDFVVAADGCIWQAWSDPWDDRYRPTPYTIADLRSCKD